MAERRSVAIQIFGHEYKIRTDADPDGVERIARLVDDTMARIRERTGTVDSMDLAVMAALNLANDLLATKERERTSRESGVGPDELRAVRELIDEAIETAPVASA